MGLIGKIESFAHAAEADLAKLWSKAPKFEDVAYTTLTYVGPILETVFTLEAGAGAGAAVKLAISKAQGELMAVKGLMSAIGPTPSVKGLLAGVVADLADLEAAAHITDSKSVANLNLVTGELNALLGSFPAPAPVPVPLPTSAAAAHAA